MNPDFNPYYVYIVYAVGGLSLFMIGAQRKWYAWLSLAAVHGVFGATGVFLGLHWLTFGNVSYFAIDLAMAYLWWRRGQSESRAAKRFMKILRNQYAEGKKEAIHELLMLQRDIEDLTNGKGNSMFSKTSRAEESSLIRYYADREEQRDRDPSA